MSTNPQLNTLASASIPNIALLKLDPLTSYALALQGSTSTSLGVRVGWSLPANAVGGGSTYITDQGFTAQGRAFTENGGSSWQSSSSRDLIYSLSVREAPASASVPAPLPVLGAAAAFGFSRKLRKRIRDSKLPATSN